KEQDLERELLVFITPHIIKDNDNKLTAQADSAILSSREQDISPKEEARLMTIQKALDGL
ncbi:MAG: hypothetical protein KJ838_02420, partial [Candidatus Omnitrophica bacterium]|nr:hypothetical protein [Candidatus Omnitrophota bacterium]